MEEWKKHIHETVVRSIAIYLLNRLFVSVSFYSTVCFLVEDAVFHGEREVRAKNIHGSVADYADSQGGRRYTQSTTTL